MYLAVYVSVVYQGKFYLCIYLYLLYKDRVHGVVEAHDFHHLLRLYPSISTFTNTYMSYTINIRDNHASQDTTSTQTPHLCCFTNDY